MTNQERLGCVSAEEFVRMIDWLYHDYGKRFNDSEPAIIKWLKAEEGAMRTRTEREAIDTMSTEPVALSKAMIEKMEVLRNGSWEGTTKGFA